MTDHLPECPLLEPCDDDVPEHGYCSMQRGAFCIHCHQWCICDRLRACEQRVAKEYRNREMNGLAWTDGYDHGVQDAREAVAAYLQEGTCVDCSYTTRDTEIIAAIDTLQNTP